MEQCTELYPSHFGGPQPLQGQQHFHFTAGSEEPLHFCLPTNEQQKNALEMTTADQKRTKYAESKSFSPLAHTTTYSGWDESTLGPVEGSGSSLLPRTVDIQC